MSPFSGDDEESLYRSIQYDRVQYLNMDRDSKDFCSQLFERQPKKRLGVKQRGVAQLKEHKFFKTIDWERLLKKEVRPDFVPETENGKLNFDDEFKTQSPRLTRIGQRELQEVDNSVFSKFTCVNPQAHAILGMNMG
jgi:serine/threonine protein kinase